MRWSAAAVVRDEVHARTQARTRRRMRRRRLCYVLLSAMTPCCFSRFRIRRRQLSRNSKMSRADKPEVQPLDALASASFAGPRRASVAGAASTGWVATVSAQTCTDAGRGEGRGAMSDSRRRREAARRGERRDERGGTPLSRLSPPRARLSPRAPLSRDSFVALGDAGSPWVRARGAGGSRRAATRGRRVACGCG